MMFLVPFQCLEILVPILGYVCKSNRYDVFLQGTPFIYQGQEIGMTNMPFESIDQVDAVDSKRLYKRLLAEGKTREEALDIIRETTRDNSRTPMQWTSNNMLFHT